jgi:hypothetical protein
VKRIVISARLLFSGVAVLLFVVGTGIVRAEDARIQWVIVTTGSALADDNSKITLSGTGTFVTGESDEVTGGGNWTTFSQGNAVTGSGTYQVTGLVKFDQAPGAVADPTIHAGLAFLRIKYSDGSRGILVVSCHLPGTPPSLFEGITASKGFVDHWNRITAGDFFRTLAD